MAWLSFVSLSQRDNYMRMWMINPKLLCNQHLLGEHGEIHKFRHNFEKQHNMSKRILLKQIEPAMMESRHNELAEEMLKRGMNHKSPYIMPDISYIDKELLLMTVNIEENKKDLISRCKKCIPQKNTYVV